MAIQVRKNCSPAFDLKGSLYTLTVMQLFHNDIDAITDHLADKIQQAPAFFQHAPIVIDLQQFEGSDCVDLALLVGMLRGNGLIPIGIIGGSKNDQNMARTMELAILSNGKASTREKEEEPPVIVDKIKLENKLVCKPVRSGQRIFAADGDLIILSHVSSGAELLASGNIHVYGHLRGRALAGVKGNQEARIFCQHLNAELVSIAGHYKVNDDFPGHVHAQATQVFLNDGKLRVDLLTH